MATTAPRLSGRALLAATVLTLILLGGYLTGPGSAAAAPEPRRAVGLAGTPIPGVDPAPGCARQVSYSVGGPTPRTAPLPAPGSQVGGGVLSTAGLHVAASVRQPPPQPRATAWLVADLDTGAVLAACNAHVPLAPASTLKILTALALQPVIGANRRYVARDQDAAVDGTRVGLVPGSVYSSDDLWHGLLMDSGNDAATALASLAGGTATAAAAMQARAVALGAADTRVLNTSGLDAPGQVTSVYDLALFGRAVLANPYLTRLLQAREYAFPEAGTVLHSPARRTFQIQNHDRLLYNYPGAIGVKDGWTSTTGGSFIGAAARSGHRYVVTVLAADPQTWHMCAALLDWAFRAAPVGTSEVGQLVTGPQPRTPPAPGPAADTVPEARMAVAAGPRRSSPSVVVPAAVTVAVLALGLIGALVRRTIRRRASVAGREPAEPSLRSRRR